MTNAFRQCVCVCVFVHVFVCTRMRACVGSDENHNEWKCCSIYVSCFIVLLIMYTFADSIVLCYGFQAAARCSRFINSLFITSLYTRASLSRCLSLIYTGKLPLPVDQSARFKWIENLYRDTLPFHLAQYRWWVTCTHNHFACAQEQHWETRVTCHSNSTCHFSPNSIWHFLFSSTCHLLWSKRMM